MAQQNQREHLVGAYEVEKFDGEVERKVYSHVDGKLSATVTKEEAGFMVYFPRGHSIRVKNQAELDKLGLGGVAPVINEDTDEVMSGLAPAPGSVKARVLKSTKSNKASPTRNVEKETE